MLGRNDMQVTEAMQESTPAVDPPQDDEVKDGTVGIQVCKWGPMGG